MKSNRLLQAHVNWDKVEAEHDNTQYFYCRIHLYLPPPHNLPERKNHGLKQDVTAWLLINNIGSKLLSTTHHSTMKECIFLSYGIHGGTQTPNSSHAHFTTGPLALHYCKDADWVMLFRCQNCILQRKSPPRWT